MRNGVSLGCQRYIPIVGEKPSGGGDISEMVDLPPGGSVTFLVAATVDPDLVVFFVLGNMASVEPPAHVWDPDWSNNTAFHNDTLLPDEVFSDGFEGGTTDAWTAVVPSS